MKRNILQKMRKFGHILKKSSLRQQRIPKQILPRILVGFLKVCINVQTIWKRIENEPNLYISNFVFLGGISSNNEFNSIACEPFWNQIFDGEQQFEAYLQECCEKEIEKSTLAWNFWQLYKANDFKQIEFNNQGDVQEKINNNLEEEVKKLKKMKDIKREVLKIPE